MAEPYQSFKEELNHAPFIIIIGKYHHIFGPIALSSTIKLEEEEFIQDLLRDALNTKNKFVILDFKDFYSQVCKIEIEDKSARGKKQLYAIILLRHVEHPLIPILHFKRIEMIFHKIGNEKILKDDEEIYRKFFRKINRIYIEKETLLPSESINLQIRSGINTIQGFCEIILEETKKGVLSEEKLSSYVEMMLDSCNDIMKALENPFSTVTQ